MKIWVVGRNYPDKSNNFQGSFELEQAKMLAKEGNDVIYLYFRLHSPLTRQKNGKFVFQDENVTVYGCVHYFTPHFASSAIRMPYLPRIRNRIVSSLLTVVEKDTGLPDIIHVHYPTLIMSAESFSAYHDKGVRIVATEHWGKVLNRQLDSFEIMQLKKYLYISDVFICVSYALRQSIWELTHKTWEIHIIPNVVNNAFHPISKNDNIFCFGFVGRLSPEKQIDRIIEAFAECFAGNTYVCLKIVGEGKERKELEKKVHAFHIEKQVIFTGAMSRDQLSKQMALFDCLVLFSNYETFGVPVVEAWACGVPVITSKAKNLMDVWDERLGISVDCHDINGLSQAMKRMIESKYMYDKNYISEYADCHFSEKAVYTQLLEVYRS